MSTPSERLATARTRAGYRSARAAAVDQGWPESTYRAHETGGRNFGLEDAEKYANAFGVDPKWLFRGEANGGHGSTTKKHLLPNATIRRDPVVMSGKRLPVLGRSAGADDGRLLMNGDIIDTVACPPGMENVPGAYAVYVVGDSMEPRYYAGETIYVHPNKPPRKGDFVVFQIKNDNEAEPPLGFVKQYITKTPTRLVVQQFNPPKEIEYDLADVISVHKVVFAGSL
jgi:phage repressor protein C with HTH and peptisase S24 domain